MAILIDQTGGSSGDQLRLYMEATSITENSITIKLTFQNLYYITLPRARSSYIKNITTNVEQTATTTIGTSLSGTHTLQESTFTGLNANTTYSFEGFFDLDIDYGDIYYAELKGSTTFTTSAPSTYSITYDKNTTDTVTSLPSADTKEAGKNFTLSSTKPARTNYTFVNWNTKTDGTGDSYSSGGTYSKDADVTLYAQWKLITYTITYYANTSSSVSGIPEAQEKIHGSNIDLSSSQPTRTGYDFIKWNSAADGTGSSYDPGDTYSNNSDLNLYAIWILKTYSVQYFENNPNPTKTTVYSMPSNQTKTYGISLELRTTIPKCYSYTFLGWSTTSDSTSINYNPGSSYTGNAALNLYAVWQCTVWSKESSSVGYIPGVLYRKTSDGYVKVHVSYKGSSGYNNPNDLG